jgi:hypothetical protein
VISDQSQAAEAGAFPFVANSLVPQSKKLPFDWVEFAEFANRSDIASD